MSNSHIAAYPSLPFVSDRKDPFDRFLIITAIEENMSIVTVDEKFKAYSHLVNLVLIFIFK